MDSPALLRYRSLFFLAFAAAATVCAAPSTAAAQPTPVAPPAPPTPAIVVPSAAPDPIAVALAPRPGGLTPEAVAQVVSRTKHSVRSKQEDLKAAAARVDQAFVGYFPKVSVSASYTRLSPIPAFSLGGLVATTSVPSSIGTLPSGTLIPNGGNLTVGPGVTIPCTTPGGCYSNLYAVNASFPIPLNSTQLVASISVPVSDYFFRRSQS